MIVVEYKSDRGTSQHPIDLLTLDKEGDDFVVDCKTIPGSPFIGRGRTMKEAMGDWLHNNQSTLGLRFDVTEAAQPAEMRRRTRELAKR